MYDAKAMVPMGFSSVLVVPKTSAVEDSLYDIMHGCRIVYGDQDQAITIKNMASALSFTVRFS